jgi:hypothetical protein
MTQAEQTKASSSARRSLVEIAVLPFATDLLEEYVDLSRFL